MDNNTLVAEQHGVQHDKSGVGHCWRSADDLPANIAEEVACWIIEDEPKPGDEYTATNGQTYRLPLETMATYQVADANSSDAGLSYEDAVVRIGEWYRDSAEWGTGSATDAEHQTIRFAISGVIAPAKDGGVADLEDYAGRVCEAVAGARGHVSFAGHGNYYVSAAAEGGYQLAVTEDSAEDD